MAAGSSTIVWVSDSESQYFNAMGCPHMSGLRSQVFGISKKGCKIHDEFGLGSDARDSKNLHKRRDSRNHACETPVVALFLRKIGLPESHNTAA